MAVADNEANMVTYQFKIPDEKWNEWKNTVPRSKSLEQRLNELIQADAAGRVRDAKVGRHDERATETVADSDEGETRGADVALPPELEDALAEFRATCEEYDAERAAVRVAAAKAIMQLLIAEDGLGKSDAQDELLPEFSVPNQSPQTWWDKQGKRLLKDVDVVEYESGRNEYVYQSE